MNFVALGARYTRSFQDITYSVPRAAEGVGNALHLLQWKACESVYERLKKGFMSGLVGETEQQTESL